MIDKKSFRVTNEQAQKICTTSYNFRDQVTGTTTHELALDILDARELIDKQEAIIREMQKYILYLKNNYGYTFPLTEMEKIDAILEKNKEYV